jgi:hypothetical protein
MAGFSFRSAAWHESELRDMMEAGVQVVLPVYWGEPSQRLANQPISAHPWSFSGLHPLVSAREKLVREGLAPPRIGMFHAGLKPAMPRGAYSDFQQVDVLLQETNELRGLLQVESADGVTEPAVVQAQRRSSRGFASFSPRSPDPRQAASSSEPVPDLWQLWNAI